MKLVGAAGLELVVGVRKPGMAAPIALGALTANDEDGLADYSPMTARAPFEGPPDR